MTTNQNHLKSPSLIISSILLMALYQGVQAAEYNPTTSSANGNTAGGSNALPATAGTNNTALGANALSNNTGKQNTAIGHSTLYGNKGDSNIAIGYRSLLQNRLGSHNTAIGLETLFSNTTGRLNTAIGASALVVNNTGEGNTAIGTSALFFSTGTSNIAVGSRAGANLKTGWQNIYLGNEGGLPDESKHMRLGGSNIAQTYIAGIRGINLSGGVPVFIDANGKLGTVNSSARFKEDIQDMASASSKLYELRPVTYRYKDTPEKSQNQRDYGLIAEEVEKVYPDLIAYDDKGQIQTVQYQKLVPMLLNEVKILNSKIQTQENLIQAQQQNIVGLQKLTAQMNDMEQKLVSLTKTSMQQADYLAKAD